MLIVNADDYGFNRRVTDATLDCFEAGVISSATAMVWMRDSDRAAALARDRELPIGLHLNLTAPFNASAVPDALRDPQHRLTRYFSSESWHGRTIAGPPPEELVAAVIHEQFRRFRELYGEATHVDGHHHVHLSPSVIRHLPADLPLRPALRHPRAAERSMPQDELLRDRTTSSRWTFAFEHLHPALGGDGFDPLQRARSAPLEVMTHPAQEGQFEALISAAWRAAIGEFHLAPTGPAAREGQIPSQG